MAMSMKQLRGAALAALGMMLAGQATAGVQVFKDGDKSLTLGAAMRASLDAMHPVPAPNSVWTNDMAVSFDIYSDWDLNPKMGFTLNLTYANTAGMNEVGLMDLVGRYKAMDEFQVWVGRIIPPNSRSNISGPYFMAPWNYPGNTDLFPFSFFGRDDGAVIWGDLGGKGKFKYFVGGFEGKRGGGVNPQTNPEAIAKVQVNLMDGEPGYYHSSTYYGTKKILAISAAGMFQSYGAGDPATDADANLTGSTLDVLFEMPFEGIGTPTVEAAGFYYDTNNYGTQVKGSSILLAYLLPMIPVQAYARYESWTGNIGTPASYPSVEDYGIQYLFDSYNARVVGSYQNAKTTGVTTGEKVSLSAQYMF